MSEVTYSIESPVYYNVLYLLVFIASLYSLYNTAHLSEFYNLKGIEESQSHSLTFILRNTKLGINWQINLKVPIDLV